MLVWDDAATSCEPSSYESYLYRILRRHADDTQEGEAMPMTSVSFPRDFSIRGVRTIESSALHAARMRGRNQTARQRWRGLEILNVARGQAPPGTDGALQV